MADERPDTDAVQHNHGQAAGNPGGLAGNPQPAGQEAVAGENNGRAAPVGATSEPSGERSGGRPWLPVLVALVIALVVLAYLLLPGVLLYPARPIAASPSTADLELQQASNAALRDQIAVLERVLQAAVCRAPDGLRLPSGGLPAMPGLPEGLPETVDPGALIPLPPEAQIVRPRRDGGIAGVAPAPTETAPPAATLPDADAARPQDLVPGPRPEPAPDAADGRSLVDHLDAATVMVIALGQDNRVSLGTAFGIGKGMLLTNQHVIDDVSRTGGRILVTNKRLGSLTEVRVVAVTPPAGDDDHADFALLQGPESLAVSPLALTGLASRLEPVTAAGYPGVLLRFDERFRRLERGDRSAAPEMALTAGAITVIQNRETVPIIAHTAAISGGSSGGPLVNACGDVVGVNTFGPTSVRTVNYALSAEAARTFLEGNGHSLQWITEPCVGRTDGPSLPESPAPKAGPPDHPDAEPDPPDVPAPAEPPAPASDTPPD